MYSIRISRQALKDLADLPKDYARLISQHIDDLAKNPRPPNTKKLEIELGYSLRVGTYRILYDIDDSLQSVTLYRVKHRREAYR
ncbi:MAG: type II toxin-antitoxin system RelE/ParE family toxin [Chloroflexota bacterium]